MKKQIDSIQKFAAEIKDATLYDFLNTPGYFSRHFYLCRFMDQQEAYEQAEEEYQKLAIEFKFDKKTKYKTYDHFRKEKSIYYSLPANRK